MGKISKSVIMRLPRYYRFLSQLEKQNIERISSNKLAEIMRSTASQVRQDLNCFGGFGHQGYGYPVAKLKVEIGKILGIDKQYNAILLGAGNLGSAIATHLKFEDLGFKLKGIFDNNDRIVGKYLGDTIIQHDNEIEEFCQKNDIKAAFLCVPNSSAPNVVERLYNKGIKCYWNFTHYYIQQDYPETVVESVHLGDLIMTLCYRINEAVMENE